MNQTRPLRIVSAAGLNQVQLSHIRQVSPHIDLVQVEPAPETLWPALASAEVLLGHFRQTGFDVARAPGLKWVQFTSASVNKVFEQPLIRSDVLLTTCSGIHAVPIAEYVLASMLAFARHFPALLRNQMQRHWATAPEVYASFVGSELWGQTVGVLGYGSIGRQVGRLASAFGMQVLACKRDAGQRADTGWHIPGAGDPDGAIPQDFYGLDRLAEFLSRCDYMVVALPLTAETRGIVDEAALRAMRPHAYLVNVGRGELVDEAALLRALKEGWIAGAGLDVAAVEPLPPESRLFDLPNVILTPHCSGTTRMYNDRVVDLFCDNLRRYVAGESLLNTLDRQRGY